MLGGIIIWAALGAWALGRHRGVQLRGEAGAVRRARLRHASPQGRDGPILPATSVPAPALPDAAPSEAAAAPCQDAARDELRVALAAAPCLGTVHAEITAYRRAEQVFAGLNEDMLLLDPIPRKDAHRCRFIGLTGTPTCGVSGAALTACESGVACASAALRPGPAQPSPAVPFAARV
ncbi:hypothetical protein [Hydrogenophaga sp.]|uniref:hypothetical protein n=1 Tax=Hydrogenophaga sp. TaxID=1904254 RepID=UPI0025C6E895|nr:hypothetical protein [Hydrogenophaga sp.]